MNQDQSNRRIHFLYAVFRADQENNKLPIRIAKRILQNIKKAFRRADPAEKKGKPSKEE